MKRIILLNIIAISLTHASIIMDYYNKATDNEMSTYLEKQMYNEAMACNNGSTRSCIALGVGSFADSAWRARELLLYFTSSGIVKKNAKRQLKRKIKKVAVTRTSSGKQRWKQGEVQIIPRRNIQGYQVEIHVDGKHGPHIHIDRNTRRDTFISILDSRGKSRSTARIFSLLPKKLRRVDLIRKKILKAKIIWRNGIK